MLRSVLIIAASTFTFILPTCGVTLNAVRKFCRAEAFFPMLSFHFGLVMFVTVIAGIFCVLAHVTGLTRDLPAAAMVERE